ncbi:MAG: YiiX/YebB-like N1pC/P60 family cysteine hydrolase [Infirmifilum sp.]
MAPTKQKGYLPWLISVLSIAIISSLPMSYALSSSSSSSSTGTLDPTYLYKQITTLARPGDLIVFRGTSKLLNIAGYWHHVAIYLGNGEIVHATPDYGVTIQNLIEALNDRVAVALIRVKTTDSVRQKAIQFALAQVGKPYDYGYLVYPGGKQVYGSSYYCSELTWASYLAAGGPDIDANPGFTLRYGYNVAPDEIVADNDVYVVASWSV